VQQQLQLPQHSPQLHKPADLQNLTAQANAAASDSERAKIKAQIGRRFGPDKVKELEAAGTLK